LTFIFNPVFQTSASSFYNFLCVWFFFSVRKPVCSAISMLFRFCCLLSFSLSNLFKPLTFPLDPNEFLATAILFLRNIFYLLDLVQFFLRKFYRFQWSFQRSILISHFPKVAVTINFLLTDIIFIKNVCLPNTNNSYLLTSSCVNWAFFSMSGPESNYRKHFIFSPQN
jgi:hypothetical protein